MARWAVFDVDGTLLPGTSMEKMFILHMQKLGVLPVRNIFLFLLYGSLKRLHNDLAHSFKNNKYYLTALPVTAVWLAGRKFVHREVWPQISPVGIDRLNRYRKEGYRILILSGSPDFLTDTLARRLQADGVITTRLENKRGYFTGRMSGDHPYGENKTRLLKMHREEWNISFSESVVFANHHSDADHMRLFGTAVAVNPTSRLQKIAGEEGWTVEWWKPGSVLSK